MLLKLCAVKDGFFLAFVKYNENDLLEDEVKKTRHTKYKPKSFIIWFNRHKITCQISVTVSKCLLSIFCN